MKTIQTSRTKKKVINKQVPTTTSIICGTENPASMACAIYNLEGGETATTFTAGRWHEGHENVLHGGLTAAIIDEMMGRCNKVYDLQTGETKIPYVTAEMTVKYLRPIAVGQKIWAYGKVDKVDGRKHFNSSELVDEDGIVYATGTGVYIAVEGLEDNNLAGGETSLYMELDENDPTEL